MAIDERTADYLELDLSEEPTEIKQLNQNPMAFGMLKYLIGQQDGVTDTD